MKTISEEILLDHGYRNWKDETDNGISKSHFQKRFTDEKGTKYFINCICSDFRPIQQGLGKHWTFDMQIETPYGAVNIEAVQWFNDSGRCSGRKIEDVEAYFEKMWQLNDCPYYELL